MRHLVPQPSGLSFVGSPMTSACADAIDLLVGVGSLGYEVYVGALRPSVPTIRRARPPTPARAEQHGYPRGGHREDSSDVHLCQPPGWFDRRTGSGGWFWGHGCAEEPRVVDVEQAQEPGHAPPQVGPHRIGWVATRAVTALRRQRPAARPGRPWRAVAQPRWQARQRCGQGAAVGVRRQARTQRGQAGSGGRCYSCSPGLQVAPG